MRIITAGTVYLKMGRREYNKPQFRAILSLIQRTHPRRDPSCRTDTLSSLKQGRVGERQSLIHSHISSNMNPKILVDHGLGDAATSAHLLARIAATQMF